MTVTIAVPAAHGAGEEEEEMDVAVTAEVDLDADGIEGRFYLPQAFSLSSLWAERHHLSHLPWSRGAGYLMGGLDITLTGGGPP